MDDNNLKIKFQMKKDLSHVVGLTITRWGKVIGKVTSYNYLNGYAGAEIFNEFHDRYCEEMGLPKLVK